MQAQAKVMLVAALIVAATVALILAAPAAPRTTCTPHGVCITEDIMSADPHIINVPPPLSEADRIEAAARDAKWEAYCKPQLVWGQNWVKHYTYAHEGCAEGRDSD